jgi:hypothetical protein
VPLAELGIAAAVYITLSRFVRLHGDRPVGDVLKLATRTRPPGHLAAPGGGLPGSQQHRGGPVSIYHQRRIARRDRVEQAHRRQRLFDRTADEEPALTPEENPKETARRLRDQATSNDEAS